MTYDKSEVGKSKSLSNVRPISKQPKSKEPEADLFDPFVDVLGAIEVFGLQQQVDVANSDWFVTPVV